MNEENNIWQKKHAPKDHKGPDIEILIIKYTAIRHIRINQEPSQKNIIHKPFYQEKANNLTKQKIKR